MPEWGFDLIQKLRIWIGKHRLASIGVVFVGLFTLCCVCLGVSALVSPPARDSGSEAVIPVSTRPNPTRTPRLTPEASGTSPVATLDVMATATFFAEQVAETQTVEAQAPTDVSAPETPMPTESILPTQPVAPPTGAPTVEPATRTPLPNDGVTGGEALGECTTGCSVSTPPAGCVIKGNVNSDNAKIYHTPGQRDYERTQIRPEQGDAWFCTEAEAAAAGFRHAQR